MWWSRHRQVLVISSVLPIPILLRQWHIKNSFHLFIYCMLGKLCHQLLVWKKKKKKPFFNNLHPGKKKNITYSLKNMKNVFHILGNLQCIPYFISDYYILKIFITVKHNNSHSLLTKSKEVIIQTFFFQQNAGFWGCWKYLEDQKQIPESIFPYKNERVLQVQTDAKKMYTKFHSLSSHFHWSPWKTYTAWVTSFCSCLPRLFKFAELFLSGHHN